MADSSPDGGDRRTTVRYAEFPDAWPAFNDFLRRVTGSGARDLCEVGGGANPALSLETIEANGLRYTILDVSAEELAKAPDGYRKLEADVASPRFDSSETFDALFSRTVLEHISDPETFHRNVFGLLKDGGVAFHFFATLYALPFVVNRLLPDRVLEAILLRLQPHRARSGPHGKFPAVYAWCRGPTARQIARFEQLGYTVEEYTGFFGHDYYRTLPAVQRLANRLAAALRRHPVPLLTSYAFVVLRKPRQGGST
jgi:SAM-dependent methyltransferase